MKRPTRSGELLFQLGVAVVAVAAFAPALRGEFLSYDDLPKLRYNSQIRGFDQARLLWMWTTTYFGLYQPVAWLTWALDFALWRFNSAGYHLTSLVCHAATAVLVYRLARRLFEITGAAGGTPQPRTVSLAAGLAAVVFAVHPLRVEPVVWISARGDVLAGLFAVGATLAYLRAVERGGGHGRRAAWYAGSLALFVLGLLAKPSAVTLPLAWLVLDVVFLRRLAFGWHRRAVAALLVEKLPFVAAAAGVSLLAKLAKITTLTMLQPPQTRPPLVVIGQSLYSLVFYLRTSVAPVGIAPLYERPARLETLAGAFTVSAVVAVALVLGLLAVRRRWPWVMPAFIAYAVLLVPVSGLFSYGSQIVAARYSYVPGIPLALLAGGALLGLRPQRAPSPRWRRPAAAVAICLVVGSLGILSWWQARMWQDSETLWTYALAMTPDSSAIHVRLGSLAEARGDHERGAAHYREALSRWPGARLDELGIGAVLEEEGHYTAAIAHYRNAVAQERDNPVAAVALGRALVLSGQPEAALEPLTMVLEGRPDLADARLLLATALIARGELDRAIGEIRRVLAADPGSARAHHHLADALVLAGRVAEAEQHWRRAMALDPHLKEIAEARGRWVTGGSAPGSTGASR